MVCQRHSHTTHTRAEFVSKHHRLSLLEAPLAWCAVRSHNSDPTSSGQTFATVNQNCDELFSIARLLRARERGRYASAPLSEDRTSVRGPQTENPPWARALNCLSRFGVCLKLGHIRYTFQGHIPHPIPPTTPRASNFSDPPRGAPPQLSTATERSGTWQHKLPLFSQLAAHAHRRSRTTRIEMNAFGSPTRRLVRHLHHTGEQRPSQRPPATCSKK